MQGSTQIGSSSRWIPWLAAATLVSGLALLVAGQDDYVDRIAPIWSAAIGAAFALTCATVARYRKATCLIATVLLLPSSIAGIFHLLRALGAIPLPVDWLALAVSVGATLTVWTSWRLCDLLRGAGGRTLDTPRWVAWVGVLAALVYPALKTSWLAGSRWLAPVGVTSEMDAAYVVPVALALLGAAAIVVALRWWERPAPGWARPVAVTGALALMGLGLGGVHASLTTPTAEGPVIGFIVYGSWGVWGLATLGVAGRLSSRRVAGAADLPPAVGVSG